MPTVIVATIHYNFGIDSSRRGGETMDNEPIFTEYELEASKAREACKAWANDANEHLRNGRTTKQVESWLTCFGDTNIILDPETMEFVTPEEQKRRDAENVKRLQEISGK